MTRFPLRPLPRTSSGAVLAAVASLCSFAANAAAAQVPPPTPAPRAEVFEYAEVLPELIGGREALQVRLEYPEVACRAQIAGQVLVEVIVDERGAAVEPVVVRTPNDLLSQAAVEAVLRSRFSPGLQRGRPVKVRYRVPVNFDLPGDCSPGSGASVDGEHPSDLSSGADGTAAATVHPWDEVPPDHYPACMALNDGVTEAEQAVHDAKADSDLGPPPTPPASTVRESAPLYADPELQRRLPVVGGPSSVAVRRSLVSAGAVVFEGEFSSGASRFRVYVAASDTDRPDATARYSEAVAELAREVERAEGDVRTAQSALRGCVEAEAWEWRQERAARAEYALTRATRRVSAREDAEPGSPHAFAVDRGNDVWVRAMTADEEQFLVRYVPSHAIGWVDAADVEEPDRVRETLRPVMARWDMEAAEEERAAFAETPDLRFTELVAVGSYSLAGVRFEFFNLRAGKTIRYLHVSVRPYDRVGGAISRARGGGPKTVTLIGPSEPSTTTSYSGEFDDLWLSDVVDCVRVTSVRAEYTDGTERSWVRNVDTLFEDPGYWNRCP